MRIGNLLLLLLGMTGLGVSQAAGELERMIFEKAEMGVPFRITLYAESAEAGRKAADAVFARVEELNSVYSDYDPESELSRLCHRERVGEEVQVSQALWKVLE